MHMTCKGELRWGFICMLQGGKSETCKTDPPERHPVLPTAPWHYWRLLSHIYIKPFSIYFDLFDLLIKHYRVSHNFRFRETFKKRRSKDATMTPSHNIWSKLYPASSDWSKQVWASQNQSDVAGSSLNSSEPAWTQPMLIQTGDTESTVTQISQNIQGRTPGIRMAHRIKPNYPSYFSSDWMKNFWGLPKITNLFVNFFSIKIFIINTLFQISAHLFSTGAGQNTEQLSKGFRRSSWANFI